MKRKNQLSLTALEATEHQLHKSVAKFLNIMLLRPAVWSTFPAGWGQLPPATAGRLKECGLKAGIPDILIWHAGKSYGIELKARANTVSQAQRTMIYHLRQAGMKIAICRNMHEVICYLDVWDIPLRDGPWKEQFYIDRMKHGPIDTSAEEGSAEESPQSAGPPPP